jgi:competence protein ComEC
VIAISGGNIALLTAIMLAGAGILRVPPRAAAGGAIAALLFYAEVTGAPASVARATTAAVIYLAGRLFDHRGPPLNALAVAAILAVAASPLTATDPGFLLSFGATLGILVLAPRLAAVVGCGPSRTTSPRTTPPILRATLGRVLRAGAMLLIATVCAEVALAPLGALLFLRITFAGLLLNFAAIPLMALVQAGSLLVLSLAAPLPTLALDAGYLTNLAARGLVDSARFVDVVPWIAVQVTSPSAWVVLVYYGACLAALVTRHRATSAAICALALAQMLVGRPAVAPAASNQLRVVFLDVGQGDATFVSMPDGCTLLVDTGGAWIGQPVSAPPDPDNAPGAAFDVGERVVVPALRALGARSLDTLVLTHGDPDHIGGAPAVLRRFAPRAIWEGVPVPPFEPLKVLARQAWTSRTAWRIVQPGDFERHGAATIRVLHPPPPEWERQRVRNDDSVVLDVRLGEVSVVLPGDIGAEGERDVIPRLVPASTVILKVPHHGSASSSTHAFLSELHPSVAVVSAGRDNRFGHPAPQVVARYREAGVRVFRTDVDGAVFVETDGGSVWIRGWTGRGLTIVNGER